MDKIKKALAKLTPAERETLKGLIAQLSRNNFTKLDIEKLKGRQDIYRARKGKIRIIYRSDHDNNIRLLAIERRNDNTNN